VHVDGEDVLAPDNTCSVSGSFFNTISKEFEHEYLDKAVRPLNTHPIHQLTDYCVPGHKYSLSGLPRTKFMVHQVWAIWFIVRRWVWDATMREALLADEMGHGKIFTSVAAAMLCKLVTEKVVIGFPLSIL